MGRNKLPITKNMIRKTLKKNNLTIALNVLYPKKEKKYPAFVSKQNSNREKQVIRGGSTLRLVR